MLSQTVEYALRAVVDLADRNSSPLRGGMTLARSPDEITILDVVNAVEPIARIRSCPLGLTAHGARLCPLHRRLDSALALVEKAFAETTLSDILAEPSRSTPLCEVPKPAKKRA
jgi:DNA-binding IscR family transcriptional regulator